jgi:hypothetical protein
MHLFAFAVCAMLVFASMAKAVNTVKFEFFGSSDATCTGSINHSGELEEFDCFQFGSTQSIKTDCSAGTQIWANIDCSGGAIGFYALNACDFDVPNGDYLKFSCQEIK